MTIPVTIQRVIFQLQASMPWSVREEYALPDHFGVGDGVIRWTFRPCDAAYPVHAIQRYLQQVDFDDPDHLIWLEDQALIRASEAYEERYGLTIERAP